MNETMVKFIKYAIVGGSTLALDLGLLYIFVEFLKIHYIISATLSLGTATLTNYYLNKAWSFSSSAKLLGSLSKYLVLFAFNYAVTMLLMYVFVEFFGFHYLTIKIITVLIIVLWNFYAYKRFIYK
jgi:putative flippase GtrA